jgi:hypothetical protein
MRPNCKSIHLESNGIPRRAANSLFRNILRISHLDSIFCLDQDQYPSANNRIKILPQAGEKKWRYAPALWHPKSLHRSC